MKRKFAQELAIIFFYINDRVRGELCLFLACKFGMIVYNCYI